MPGPSAEQKQEIAERVRVGTFYLDRGQYSAAIAEFEAAQTLDPQDRDVAEHLDRARKALEAENTIRSAQ